MAQARRPSVDDVRQAFYAQAPPQQWIREIHLEPLELIVSDDHATVAMRVPVQVSAAGEITFRRGRRVRVKYIEVDPLRVDASRLVYASRGDSTGTPVQAAAGDSTTGGSHVERGSPTGVRGDRYRRPDEDVAAWAVATGRIKAETEAYWRRMVQATAATRDNERLLERLTPVPEIRDRRRSQAVAAASDPDDYMSPELVEMERRLHSGIFDPPRAATPPRKVAASRAPGRLRVDEDDTDDPEVIAMEARLHGHVDQDRQRRRVEGMRAVVEGRSVHHGYDRREIAAMRAELDEIDGRR